MPNEAAAEEPVEPLPAANPSDEPTGGTHLTAIFDREVTLMNITDHVILFDTPELVLTMDHLEGMLHSKAETALAEIVPIKQVSAGEAPANA